MITNRNTYVLYVIVKLDGNDILNVHRKSRKDLEHPWKVENLHNLHDYKWERLCTLCYCQTVLGRYLELPQKVWEQSRRVIQTLLLSPKYPNSRIPYSKENHLGVTKVIKPMS